jgi:hypothetical protein
VPVRFQATAAQPPPQTGASAQPVQPGTVSVERPLQRAMAASSRVSTGKKEPSLWAGWPTVAVQP